MIGIGVGIDYALFIVTRYREALARRRSTPTRRSSTSIDTGGRAVLFAGGTVVISLLGLFLMGVSFIRGLAVGAVARGAVRDGRPRSRCCRRVLGFVGHTIDKFGAAASQEARSCRRQKEPLGRWARTCSAPVARRRRRPAHPASCLRCRSSRCASASPTPATTRRVTPRAAPTTCSPRASARASTVRCSSWPTSRAARAQRPMSLASMTRCTQVPGRGVR